MSELASKEKPRTICLVGSVKQEADWRKWTALLTAKGYRVWEAGLYGTVGNGITQEVWDRVTLIHFSKIDDSDTIAIIRKPDGTIGEDTKADVDYALGQGKEVVWVETIE